MPDDSRIKIRMKIRQDKYLKAARDRLVFIWCVKIETKLLIFLLEWYCWNGNVGTFLHIYTLALSHLYQQYTKTEGESNVKKENTSHYRENALMFENMHKNVCVERKWMKSFTVIDTMHTHRISLTQTLELIHSCATKEWNILMVYKRKQPNSRFIGVYR